MFGQTDSRNTGAAGYISIRSDTVTFGLIVAPTRVIIVKITITRHLVGIVFIGDVVNRSPATI